MCWEAKCISDYTSYTCPSFSPIFFKLLLDFSLNCPIEAGKTWTTVSFVQGPQVWPTIGPRIVTFLQKCHDLQTRPAMFSNNTLAYLKEAYLQHLQCQFSRPSPSYLCSGAICLRHYFNTSPFALTTVTFRNFVRTIPIPNLFITFWTIRNDVTSFPNQVFYLQFELVGTAWHKTTTVHFWNPLTGFGV